MYTLQIDIPKHPTHTHKYTGHTHHNKLTIKPDMSAYFFGGLREGGASILLSAINKMV